MVLTTFEGLNEENRNKILKSIISHIDFKKESSKDEGEITVNFL